MLSEASRLKAGQIGLAFPDNYFYLSIIIKRLMLRKKARQFR
jgi:hypothetical protein